METAAIMYHYNAMSAAHKYNLGFLVHDTLYNIFLTFEELAQFCKPGRASSSRGGFMKIRIRLVKADKLALIEKGAKPIGTMADLSADAGHNAGDNYERIVKEFYTSEKWSKDSTPFWKAGDVNIGGEEVQIKLDGGELTNERTMARLLARA